jgi:hypothetical protein
MFLLFSVGFFGEVLVAEDAMGVGGTLVSLEIVDSFVRLEVETTSMGDEVLMKWACHVSAY